MTWFYHFDATCRDILNLSLWVNTALQKWSTGALTLHCIPALAPIWMNLYQGWWKTSSCSTVPILVLCYLAWPRVPPPPPLQEYSPTWCTHLLAHSCTPRLWEVGGWRGWRGVGAPANNTPYSDSIEVTWHMYSTNHRTLQQRKQQ